MFNDNMKICLGYDAYWAVTEKVHCFAKWEGKTCLPVGCVAGGRVFKEDFDWLDHGFGVKANPLRLGQFVWGQLCISSITLGELHYGAEKSARRIENLTAIEHFVARREVLPFRDKAAIHYGEVRAELERIGTPCGPHVMQIGAHAQQGFDCCD